MAYVTARKNGTWEVRESARSAKGPRSRTLASFRELTPDVIEQVKDRSSMTVDVDDLRRRAVAAGAPMIESFADRSAAELLRQSALGHHPRKAIIRLLAETFEGSDEPVSDPARAMAAWIGATQRERSEALIDLLLLADHLPPSTRRPNRRFPAISSV